MISVGVSYGTSQFRQATCKCSKTAVATGCRTGAHGSTTSVTHSFTVNYVGNWRVCQLFSSGVILSRGQSSVFSIGPRVVLCTLWALSKSLQLLHALSLYCQVDTWGTSSLEKKWEPPHFLSLPFLHYWHYCQDLGKPVALATYTLSGERSKGGSSEQGLHRKCGLLADP